MSGNRLAGYSDNRQKDDFYATPPKCVIDLLNQNIIKGDSVYEPCCGQGHISKVLENKFKIVYSTDLIDRGYGRGGVDFLNSNFIDNVDWVVTNPPFKLAKEFVNKSLSITNKGVAMFLKIQFLEGQSRKEWFKSTPLKYVCVFSERQSAMKDGLEYNPDTGKKWASTTCFAWYIWEHGYTGEPIIRWI